MAAVPPINMALVLSAVDTTGRAFASVGAKADKLAGRIGKTFGKLKKAIPGILGGMALKMSLNDMNALNDAAQRAGVSAKWLKQFSGAMAQFGVQLGQQDVVSSVQKLNAGLVNLEKVNALEKLGIDVKSLQGLSPEKAFTGFLDIVAKIPDEQTRLLALMRGMEEQGLKLAPIMRQGPDAFHQALSDVMGMIPAANDASVVLATNANNALSLAGDSFKVAWYDALGSILGWTEETFGGVDNVVLAVAEAIRYRIELVAGFCQVTFHNLGAFLANVFHGIGAAMREPGLILEWIQHQAKKVWAVFQAIKDWVSSKFGDGESMSAMDAFGQAIVGIETENANWDERLNGIGVEWKEMESLGDKIDKIDKAHFERTKLQVDGLKAKKQFDIAVPPIPVEKMQTQVKSAVKEGVKQGLTDGVEAGSYDALKSVFRASGLRDAWQNAGAGRTRKDAAGKPTPSKTSNGSPAGGGASDGGSAVRLLRDILTELKTANRTFGTMGAF